LSLPNIGQINALQDFVDEGIELYDRGEYNGALTQYKKALEIDAKSPLANYEISSTYFALQDYGKAIEHSNKVISAKSDYVDQAYILKGSAQDLMSGKPKEALKTYKSSYKKVSE
jgi:tetratricopeptide (TPR) repeat protein